MKHLSSLFLFCLLAATCLVAQKQECYVITAAGQRQKAISIKADPQGNLTVNIDGKIKAPFKAGAYKIAVVPKPKEITELEKLANEEKFEELITAAPAVFDAYKYLGWADAIAALQCEAYLARRISRRTSPKKRPKLISSLLSFLVRITSDFSESAFLISPARNSMTSSSRRPRN